MADEADIADILTQQRLESTLAQVRAAKPDLLPQQHCHSCGASLGEDSKALFCNDLCSEDFERAVAAAIRNKGVTRRDACNALSAAPPVQKEPSRPLAQMLFN